MDIIFSASILAAFLAGMVALFAPCCITVLLPAYLASAFREKRNIVAMSLIFFSGIAAILIPIGLGAAWLAELFQDFHRELYIIGGAFMVVLAALAFAGKNLPLIPFMSAFAPRTRLAHAKSVFLLGVFSGAATSCCAPVLAGAMTLAVLSGTFWKALAVTFAYVFGMTFPLFVAAYFYDRFHIEKSRFVQGTLWRFRVFGRDVLLHSTNALAGGVFFLMGIVLLALAFRGTAYWAPSYQTAFGERLNLWSTAAFEWLSSVPDALWGLAIAAFFAVLLYHAFKRRADNGDPAENKTDN